VQIAAAAAAEVAIEENHNQNQVIISKRKKQFDLPAEEQIAVVVAAGAIKLRKFI